MNAEQKYHAILMLVAMVGALALGIGVVQFMGGWAVASKSGFFGGAVVMGMTALVAYAVYRAVRSLLAIRVWNIKSSRTRTGDSANPLAEAEVYAAYGRKAEAIKILKDALARDAGNVEIREKLEALRRD